MKNQTLIRLHSVYCNYCLIAIALIFTSCGSIYYAPNQPHLPMIKEKGITKVNVQLAAGEYSSTMDINAVHSVTDHLGLMGNFASYYLDGNGMNTIDVGFGYYKPVSQHAGFEIYPGIGYGKLSVIDSWSGEYTYEVKSFRTFIQPDIFYETEHFGAALGLRVLYFKYQSHFQSYIGETPSNLMLEPTG